MSEQLVTHREKPMQKYSGVKKSLFKTASPQWKIWNYKLNELRKCQLEVKTYAICHVSVRFQTTRNRMFQKFCQMTLKRKPHEDGWEAWPSRRFQKQTGNPKATEKLFQTSEGKKIFNLEFKFINKHDSRKNLTVDLLNPRIFKFLLFFMCQVKYRPYKWGGNLRKKWEWGSVCESSAVGLHPLFWRHQGQWQ